LRRRFALPLALALLGYVVAGALAHTRSYAGTVTLDELGSSAGTARFEGRVTSPKAACESGRTVKVFVVDGNGSTLLARGKTGSAGSYSLTGDAPGAASDVFAKVTRKTLRRGSAHEHVCAADETATTRLPGDVDLTALPVGDDSISTSPQTGKLWSCRQTFDDPGGVGAEGPWFNGDGTWDLTKKVTVSGSVEWPESLAVEVDGATRTITTNDLPDHPTGTFPIAQSDDAYQYDRNPNSISAQDLEFHLPAAPEVAASPSCAGGTVGVMLSGSVVFSAIDAGGRDAVAHEVQDDCGGHPQNTGVYHYHSLGSCSGDDEPGRHSALVGYAFDGFGIYGHQGEGGEILANDDLDACHGHTHPIEWDGETRSMYHYHSTYEFPYTVGCYRGTPAQTGRI
jgi:hypothetical protein